MKFLVELGKQLDLNVAWDGGLPDNVTYQVSSNDNAVTITNDGIVSGINVGIAVVKFINSGGVEVGSAIFEVMTAQQYEKVNALRSGTKTLTIEAVEVQQGPPPSVQISLNTMTSASPQGGYIAFGDVLGHSPAWQAFDADVDSIAQAYAPDANTVQTVGQILPAPKVLTQYTITTRQYSNHPKAWELQGSTDTTSGSDGTWVTIQSVANQEWVGTAPFYQQPENVTYSTTPGGTDVATKTFSVVNTTAYKAYRIRLTYSAGNGIYNFYSLVLTGY